MTLTINAYCPDCGYQVDSAAGVGDAAGDVPEEGDMAICIRCAAVGVYRVNDDGETLGLRLPSSEEKVQLSENQELQEARELVARMNVKGWYDS